MRVAFATSDLEHVDEQFRRCSQVAVYEVGPAGFRLEGTCAFSRDGGQGTDDRVRAIEGASLVFVSAIGPSSTVRLAKKGIRAATAPRGTRIPVLLAYLCRTLAGEPGHPAAAVAP